VYQSNQATAAACQVNNVNLILGKIGRSGCGIMQMNGQPTAQNTRETGEKLSRGSGIQWPCNEQWPDGCERIYADLRFHTAADVTQTFGHDLEIGAATNDRQPPGSKAAISVPRQ
jgi:anaerobic selenocysteine-containing dehydrogenase